MIHTPRKPHIGGFFFESQDPKPQELVMYYSTKDAQIGILRLTRLA